MRIFSTKLLAKKNNLTILVIFWSTIINAQFSTQNAVTDLNTFPNDLAFYTPASVNAPTSYGTILALRHWGGAGGSDWRTQLAFAAEKDFYFRQSINTAGTVWTQWQKIYHSGNFNNSDIDFNAKQIKATELVISGIQSNILFSSTGDSYLNSGNFGIGTINPKNKLDVNGTVHSKEVKVDMDNWSDFVFKKEYNLPTLLEVEKHINENGHLKDIPSEKEVIQDGLNLGEIDRKLLQKIEELTLYVIELNKKIEQQNQELSEMKKKIGN